MEPLRHGYTNRTLRDGTAVVKRYQGPDARVRAERERAMLLALRGRVPVPPVLGFDDECLTMGFIGGTHGQELIQAGQGRGVLHACGTMLRQIHHADRAGALPAQAGALPGRARALPGRAGALPCRIDEGEVLVHGDYGPQNVLLDPATWQITAVLDWEWAHPGQPVEDLAWCEWIVRMHHPGQANLLGAFFAAYDGPVPPWPDRHAFMVERCRSLLDLCHREDPGGPGETQWARRLSATRAWQAQGEGFSVTMTDNPS